MKKLTFVTAFVLALLSITAASATEMDSKAVEQIAVDLETLLSALEGVDHGDVTLRTYDSGISVYSIPLPEDMRPRLQAASASGKLAKDFAPLAVGLQLSNPTSFSSLITAVEALTSTDYNFWCVVANLKDVAQTKKTTLQMKGAGKVSDTLTFDAFSLHLPTVAATTTSVFGIVQLSCKVTSGGKAKAKFLAN
jgi:hypothetical protein